MRQERADIIERLRKDVLLQRFSIPRNKSPLQVFFEPFAEAFHSRQFPLGTVHEFICTDEESFSASAGFISGILKSVMQNNGIAVWIGPSQKMFPPAFTLFGIKPDKVIFITRQNPKEILWIMEEALKCKGIAAVVCDTRELSFKQSRRLQLATEQSLVTGFILRKNPRIINTTACSTRWVITPTLSRKHNNLPGIGQPCWTVELQKVKNGKPGSWTISFHSGKFILVQESTPAIVIHQKKAV